MTVRRGIILAVLVVIAALALLFLATRLTTTSEAATPVGERTDHAAKITRNQTGALIKAAGLFAQGKNKRAVKVLRKAFGRGWKMKMPRRTFKAKSSDRVVVHPRRSGCSVGYVTGVTETGVIGFDLFNASLWQRFCYRKGHLTKVFRPHVSQDVTDWGEAVNWDAAGISRESAGWTNYGGKRHGGHYLNVSARFHGCAPIPTGCILPTDQRIRLSLVVHAGGGTDTRATG